MQESRSAVTMKENPTMTTTMKVRASVLLLLVASFAACAPTTVTTNYGIVSSHTLQVAADKTTDVVWVQQLKAGEFVWMRCYNASEGPQCVRAKTP